MLELYVGDATVVVDNFDALSAECVPNADRGVLWTGGHREIVQWDWEAGDFFTVDILVKHNYHTIAVKSKDFYVIYLCPRKDLLSMESVMSLSVSCSYFIKNEMKWKLCPHRKANWITIVFIEMPRMVPLARPTYKLDSKLSRTQLAGAAWNKRLWLGVDDSFAKLQIYSTTKGGDKRLLEKLVSVFLLCKSDQKKRTQLYRWHVTRTNHWFSWNGHSM